MAENRIRTLYIEPGRPWQNRSVESFNARLREECLNREQMWTLTEARGGQEDWRWKDNHVRPHRSLGYVTPLALAQQEAGRKPGKKIRDSYQRHREAYLDLFDRGELVWQSKLDD